MSAGEKNLDRGRKFGMKKWFFAVMTAALLFGLGACGQEEGKDLESGGNTQMEGTQTEQVSSSQRDAADLEGGSEGISASGAGEGDSLSAGGAVSEEPLQDDASQALGLAELYQENFSVGIALPNYVFSHIEEYQQVIADNFNSITCENEMKPDSLLDKKASQADLENTYLHAAVHFDNCMPAVEFALEHDMKMRFHTLVWYSQTPKWFFTEDYTDDGELVSRETMLARMENYIADVLGYFQENYPGLIYAVDVVNEAFDIGNGDENGVRMKDNRWYDTVGDDFYYHAFVFARKYASEDMKLFYNDYGCMYKTELILERLKQAKDEGLIDGIGMQSHLSVSDDIRFNFMLAAKAFCEEGYEVQATELDIGVKESSKAAFRTQGSKYKSFFRVMRNLEEEGWPITNVTVWGLNDALSWRKDEFALMFDEDMEPKPAYLGAMLDESVWDE